jgi:hypothetical protein
METVMIRHANMDVRFQFITWTSLTAAAVVIAGTTLFAAEASAVSARVKIACAKDYLAHCRQFAPGSAKTRQCMRDVGDDLSPRCVKALVAEGEVSAKEVAEHVAAKGD